MSKEKEFSFYSKEELKRKQQTVLGKAFDLPLKPDAEYFSGPAFSHPVQGLFFTTEDDVRKWCETKWGIKLPPSPN